MSGFLNNYRHQFRRKNALTIADVRPREQTEPQQELQPLQRKAEGQEMIGIKVESEENDSSAQARDLESLLQTDEETRDNSIGLVTTRHHAAPSSVPAFKHCSSVARSRKEIFDDPSIDVHAWKKKGNDALQSVMSALYCKILVILGLAFPMAEVISVNVPRGFYQLFYVYLFLGSLLFLLYIYVEVCRTRTKARRKQLVTKLKRKASGGGSNSKNEDEFPVREHRLIPGPKQIYGSFYIRMGAVLFGIGSMIYSGIEVGAFFEVGLGIKTGCRDFVILVRPFLQVTFVFVQMYFIFLNHKMNIYKNKLVSRFGLMHMIATNICVWFNVLILETYHEIADMQHKRGEMESSQVMSGLLARSGPFLFPCTIEYSLISAAVLYMMWKNISDEHNHYKTHKRRNKISFTMRIPLQSNEEELARNQYSVDCSNANNGLFSGILVVVLTIISLIIFFVLIQSEDTKMHTSAITVASVTELALYSLTTIAVLIGMIQVRTLWYDSARKLELDNLLLVVAQTGVLIYSSFCIIGAFFQWKEHLTSFLASLATLIQTTLQTIFILDASNRFAYCAEQVRTKPGRQVVTFLLVCNLSMWAINTLETNRADSHPIQVDFYGGDWVWPIITHVSMPLAIFYRFHSTVCLCEIWTKSFKYKEYAAYMEQ